jgi:16S rRNA (guanine527-N7)-methyltransferase
MDRLAPAHIAETLAPYGVIARHALCEQIRQYILLLSRWNQKISLTTLNDPDEVLKFHFGESFFAAGSVPINDGRLADVGSGAGFPGIPLAMVCPGLAVTLIESNVKKAAFLGEVIRALRLNRVTVIRSRMEELSKDLPKFDFITARALGMPTALLRWAHGFLVNSGRIVLWLGEKDCRAISNDSSWNWRDPIRIPGSRSRCLLVGSPKPRD